MMGLSLDKQKEYLLNKKGNSVHFKYPKDEVSLEGTLKDRFAILDNDDGRIVYWNIIDLIKFKDYEENWLRVTYYRYKKKENRWIFAGQTSLSDPISKFSELFVNAVKEKDWFRNFFKEITQQCSKHLK